MSRRLGSWYWRAIRAEVLRDEPDCLTCGAPARHVDHILPVSEGGTDDPANLQSLCAPCHAAKTGTEHRRRALARRLEDRDRDARWGRRAP